MRRSMTTMLLAGLLLMAYSAAGQAPSAPFSIEDVLGAPFPRA